jgi:hypothetical protein
MTIIFLALILLSGSSSAVADGHLKRYQPEEKVYERSGPHIFYEAGVSLQAIRLFDRYLSERLNDQITLSIYKMPLTRDLYLVSGHVGGEKGGGERSRYCLFRKSGARLIMLDCILGWDDKEIVSTTFFIGKDRVLVMANTGAPPDFECVEVFEFKNTRLKYLGPLTVVKKERPTGVHGDYTDPLENAAAEFKANTYYVTMKGNLYSVWGSGTQERKIATPNSPVTYYFDGKKFRMSRKTRR